MCFDFDKESTCPPQHSLSYAFDDGGHDVYICIASKRGTRAARMNSQKFSRAASMNSQKFSFGKPPCVFENQFRLRLAHRMHLDFQNLINMPNLARDDFEVMARDDFEVLRDGPR